MCLFAPLSMSFVELDCLAERLKLEINLGLEIQYASLFDDKLVFFYLILDLRGISP